MVIVSRQSHPASARTGSLPNVLRKPPLVYRIAKSLRRTGLPGSHLLGGFARSRGWLDVTVRYSLSATVSIDVPLAYRSYDRTDVLNYEREMVNHVSGIANSVGEPFVLIDCGADIGLISARLVSVCPKINRVVAIEPNPESFRVLQDNLALLPVPAEGRNIAIADFSGRGNMQHPDHDAADVAAFLEPCDNGSCEVATIDDLSLPAGTSILMKVDVEGGELAAIRGASRTLATSRQFIVVFEAHPQQVKRTGIDPASVVSYVRKLRPCMARVTEAPAIDVPSDKPFFETFSPERVYNVCVRSV